MSTIEPGFIPFSKHAVYPQFRTPAQFRLYVHLFYLDLFEFEPGGFASSLAQPSGVVGQGASI